MLIASVIRRCMGGRIVLNRTPGNRRGRLEEANTMMNCDKICTLSSGYR